MILMKFYACPEKKENIQNKHWGTLTRCELIFNKNGEHMSSWHNFTSPINIYPITKSPENIFSLSYHAATVRDFFNMFKWVAEDGGFSVITKQTGL